MSTEPGARSGENWTTANVDNVWLQFGVDAAFLETRAAWLAEKRKLHSRVMNHFHVAASLINCSWHDYKLGSAAFFHAVLGLEKALKLHYQSNDGKLKELLAQALSDGLVLDAMFEPVPAFTEYFDEMVSARVEQRPASYAELLVQLIPAFRNEYMHGEYLLAPDFLHLTFQVRKIADQLTTVPT